MRQESTNKNYAEYVINHRTSVQKVDPVTVKLQRSETDFRYVEITEIETADLKSKVGIKAKFDLLHSSIKNVPWKEERRVSRVMNEAYTGASVKFTLWELGLTLSRAFMENI